MTGPKKPVSFGQRARLSKGERAQNPQFRGRTPHERQLLLRRLGQMTHLQPLEIARYANVTLPLVNRFLEYFVQGVETKRPPLFEHPTFSFPRRGREPKLNTRLLTELSEKTETFAQVILGDCERMPPANEGFDLLWNRRGKKLKVEVKLHLTATSNAFPRLKCTPEGKLMRSPADLYLVFSLDGLTVIRGQSLRSFLDKHGLDLKILKVKRGGRQQHVFLPVKDMAEFGFARKIPYLEDIDVLNPRLPSIPMPGHLEPYRARLLPRPNGRPFLTRPKPRRIPPRKE